MPGLQVIWTARGQRWPDTCSPVQRIDVPSRRFSHVHVDLVGPLPSVRGYTHVFTVVDRLTRWPAAYPIQETSTRACIDSLLQRISCFGGINLEFCMKIVY